MRFTEHSWSSRRGLPRRLLLVATLLIFAGGLHAHSHCADAGDARQSASQPATAPQGAEDVSRLLEPIRRAYRLPALAGAIVHGNRLTAIAAVGRRKSNTPDPVTVNDQFHLGSCTKSMTGTLIGMLVEEGTLSWSSTVGQTFPELQDKIDPAYTGVTIEQLLRHRSGLPEDRTPDALFIRMRLQLKGPMIQQRLKAVEWLLEKPPANPPGSTMQYSNQGYLILGAMAERVTGKSWEELMRERLFEPLGMKSAGFGTPGVEDKVDQPYGHVRGFFGVGPVDRGPLADNPPWLGPAGTVHASLPDWAKYVSLHLEGIRGRSTLLSAQTLAALYCPGPGEGSATAPSVFWSPAEILAVIQGQRAGVAIPEGYAAGWVVTSRTWGGLILTHSGSNGVWLADLALAPQKGFAVLAATNIGDSKAAEACDRVLGVLIEHFQSAGNPASAPSQP